MGRTRNLHLKSLFKPRNNPKSFSSSWPWPSCKQPKTLSFRLPDDEPANNVDNLAYLLSSTDSCFTASSSVESESLSRSPGCSVEAAMQAMSSNRLLFDGRTGRSSSITEKISSNKEVGVPFEGSVAVEVESEDLYRDFLVSMKEMAEAEGELKKDLVWFEEMLEWYLKMNDRWTHEFIVEAYWDLLLEMMGSSSSASDFISSSSSSTCSSYSSSYVSCLSEIEEVEEEEGDS